MIPIPPAMSRTLRRVRRAPVSAPYGPSTKTRVPDRDALERGRRQSPSSLTVIRSHSPLGADEIENGWPRHQPSRVRKRQTKYWPDADGEPVEIAPGQVDRDDARRLADDVRDAQPVAQRQPDRLAEPEDQDSPAATTYSATQYSRGDRVVGEVGPDDELVEERQRDRQVGVQVEAVPRSRTTGARAPRASS